MRDACGPRGCWEPRLPSRAPRAVGGGELPLHLGAGGGIREQLVRLQDLLEAALQLLRKGPQVAAEVAIRVELLGEPEVGLLDRLDVGVDGHAEDLVVGPVEPGFEFENLPLAFRRRDPGSDRSATREDSAPRPRRRAVVGRRRRIVIEQDHALLHPAVDVPVHLLGRQAADLAEHLAGSHPVDSRQQIPLGRRERELGGVASGGEPGNPILTPLGAPIRRHRSPPGVT